MGPVDTIYILIGVTIFQAYQIWRIDGKLERTLDMMVGLHLGRLEITEVDEDEY